MIKVNEGVNKPVSEEVTVSVYSGPETDRDLLLGKQKTIANGTHIYIEFPKQLVHNLPSEKLTVVVTDSVGREVYRTDLDDNPDPGIELFHDIFIPQLDFSGFLFPSFFFPLVPIADILFSGLESHNGLS
jgi:hypothetical protein